MRAIYNLLVLVVGAFFSLSAAASMPEIADPPKFIESSHIREHLESGKFNPQEVACSDQSNEENRKKLEEIRNNPDGDLYWMTYLGAILDFSKALANQGNHTAMRAFGGLKSEFWNVALEPNENGKGVKPPLMRKEDIVIALTYLELYVSSESDPEKTKKIQESLDRKNNNPVLQQHPEWIAEAKENAERWREYCSKKASQ